MKTIFKTLAVVILLLTSNQSTSQEAYLGDIKLTAISFNQRDWLPCEGQLLPIAQYQALFSLLGTNFGGDGMTTFALPDLRGRVPIGIGNGPGLSNVTIGQTGGTESNTLTVNQIPNHNHTINAVTTDGNQSIPTGNLPGGTKFLDREYSDASANTTMNANMVGSTGGGQPIENRQPYIGVRYVICVVGIYPSQN